MRCPKCGKNTDVSVSQCPVCYTIIQQPQYQPQSYPQQNNTRFCSTCGSAMSTNATFCSRCGASIYAPNIMYSSDGINHSKISYLVYVLIGSNLILAFTSLIGFVSQYFDPSTPHGSHTETYSFWDVSSVFWQAYKRVSESGYSGSKSDLFWCIVSVVTMYFAIALCALFIIISLYKAYARISSNNKSNIPALKSLLAASIMAIIQLISLFVLKCSMGYKIPLTSWFWAFVVLAGFSFIAEIFLIKADSTSNKGYL